MPAITSVICDMDGTLVDTEGVHLEAWNVLLEQSGHQPPAPGWNDDSIGLPDIVARDKTLRLFPDLAQAGDILEEKQRIFRRMIAARGHDLVYPGVRDGLERLRTAGIKVALGTNSVMDNTRSTLESAGLQDCFDVIVTADSVANGKPAPDIYREAAVRLGVRPAECLVLEDSVAGLEAGRAAGGPVAGVTNSWPRNKLVPADLVFDSTAAALAWALDHAGAASHD